MLDTTTTAAPGAAADRTQTGMNAPDIPPDPSKPADAPDDQEPKSGLGFTPGDWTLAAIGGLLAAGVSGIGLASSYRALERKAAAAPADGGWGWESPWMLPVGLDLSILAFSIINLILIKADRPLAWVKWIPRLGAVATIYLNWQSAVSGPSQFGHAALVALWVVFSEIAAHLYAAHIDAVKARVRMEGVRLSRWLLDPFSTAVIARQMKLWEITSYERALTLHKERKVYKQGLRQRYGRLWRWKAPTDELLPVRLARFGLTVDEALEVPGKEAAAAAVREHEAGVRTRALALRLEEERATAALAEVERQAGIATATARAEAARLEAEAEVLRAQEEARTAADAVVRKAELDALVATAEAEATAEKLRAAAAAEADRIRFEAERAQETERLEAEARKVKSQVTAEAEARRATAEAEAEAARIRRQEERESLEWQSEQARLLAEQETAKQQAAALQTKLAAEQAEIEKRRAVAEQQKAEAVRRAAEDLRKASAAEKEAAVTRAEQERIEAEEKAARAAAEAEAAEKERAMAVALEAASVAHESARRTPAERQAHIVADMIRQFGEETVTISYIRRALDLPHSTAQDRRDRARQILAGYSEDAGEATEAA
jgi:hypothetical protein